MNSFNHYAYGAIGEWMYSVVAGITLDEKQPGYKHIFIQPRPGGGLTFAKASVQSMYGKVAAGWELAAGKMTLKIEVPSNTSATVLLPQSTLQTVTESGKALADSKEVKNARQNGNTVQFDVGSGAYIFESTLQGHP
jgi:alpha-L-rhamnosidase